MDPSNIPRTDHVGAVSPLAGTSGQSAASWPAIFAGAVAAAATSLILIALGAGLGFATMSPWPGHGASAAAFAVTTAIWLIVTQWVSAGLGGYIAGRLRTRWVGTHTHEVFFRDTAHGFVTWSVATVLVAGLFAAAAVSGIGAGARVAGGAVATAGAGWVAAGGTGGNAGSPSLAATGMGAPGSGLGADVHGSVPGAHEPMGFGGYDTDRLFRPATGVAAGTVAGGPGMAQSPQSPQGMAGGGPGGAGDARSEAAHIMANALVTGDVPDDDRQYLSSLVAAKTGLSQADAEKRVDDYIAKLTDASNKARAAADSARKAAAQAAIYTALSMLIGAFIASVAAALGGRLRDEHV